MGDLETYLRRATRGLPAPERRRVREELRGSVLERAAEHRLAGLDEAQARRAAVREFGDPAPLAGGMRRLYLWPRVSAISALMGTALVGGWLTLAPGAAQTVSVTTRGPVPGCEQATGRSGTCLAPGGFWLSLASLRAELARQGATARALPGQPEDTLTVSWQEPGGAAAFRVPITNRAEGRAVAASRQEERQLVQRLAEQAREEELARARAEAQRSGRPSESVSGFRHVVVYGQQDRYSGKQVFARQGDTLLYGPGVLGALMATATRPGTLERPLDAPLVRFGGLTLALGQPGQGVSAAETVRRLVADWLWRERGLIALPQFLAFPEDFVLPGQPPLVRHRLKVAGRPGEVYALLYRAELQGHAGLRLSLGQVDAAGNLQVAAPQPVLDFAADWTALPASPGNREKVALLRLGAGLPFGPGARPEFRLERP